MSSAALNSCFAEGGRGPSRDHTTSGFSCTGATCTIVHTSSAVLGVLDILVRVACMNDILYSVQHFVFNGHEIT
jgi:hypothetical protein